MTTPLPVVIIGASAAGVSAARTLRLEGWQGGIILIDADQNAPYERPPLSKKALQEPDFQVSEIRLLTPLDVQELQLQLETGRRATAISASGLAVTLDDGRVLAGSAILIATGGKALRLNIEGADLSGVHVLRDLADAEAVRGNVARAEAVAVIGGGLIGAEAAVAISHADKRVIWLDGAVKPLAHILPAAIADYLIAAHRTRGIELRTSVKINRFLAADGCVCGIEFADGEVLGVQAVIMGVGMAPEDSLAKAAGLDVSRGIHVGANQLTSVTGIFAAGDVAAFWDENKMARYRHEHWRAAEEQGANAARAILGKPVVPPALSWFWSDQGAHHVEMAGRKTGDSIVRIGPKGPIVFEMDGDNLAGVASVDEPNAVRIGMRLIQNGRPLLRSELADTAVELRTLLKK